MVVRVGDGVLVLGSSAVPVFVERRYFDSVGDIVKSIALQSDFIEGGANLPLTLSGSATSRRDPVSLCRWPLREPARLCREDGYLGRCE